MSGHLDLYHHHGDLSDHHDHHSDHHDYCYHHHHHDIDIKYDKYGVNTDGLFSLADHSNMLHYSEALQTRSWWCSWWCLWWWSWWWQRWCWWWWKIETIVTSPSENSHNELIKSNIILIAITIILIAIIIIIILIAIILITIILIIILIAITVIAIILIAIIIIVIIMSLKNPNDCYSPIWKSASIKLVVDLTGLHHCCATEPRETISSHLVYVRKSSLVDLVDFQLQKKVRLAKRNKIFGDW